MEMQEALTVLVEGNIGAGKSSFLEYAKEKYEDVITVQDEPIESWRNYFGHNILNLFYQAPEKNAFLMQAVVQLSLVQYHLTKAGTECRVRLMSRSLHSSVKCFSRLLHSEKVCMV